MTVEKTPVSLKVDPCCRPPLPSPGVLTPGLYKTAPDGPPKNHLDGSSPNTHFEEPGGGRPQEGGAAVQAAEGLAGCQGLFSRPAKRRHVEPRLVPWIAKRRLQSIDRDIGNFASGFQCNPTPHLNDWTSAGGSGLGTDGHPKNPFKTFGWLVQPLACLRTVAGEFSANIFKVMLSVG